MDFNPLLPQIIHTEALWGQEGLEITLVKFHFYRRKEQLMSAAGAKNTLSFQVNSYQIFSDLAPLAKWKVMRLQLQVLNQHQIRYCWSFPFAIQFAYNGKQYTSFSPDQCTTWSLTDNLVQAQLPWSHKHKTSGPCSITPQHTVNGLTPKNKGTPAHQTGQRPQLQTVFTPGWLFSSLASLSYFTISFSHTCESVTTVFIVFFFVLGCGINFPFIFILCWTFVSYILSYDRLLLNISICLLLVWDNIFAVIWLSGQLFTI